MPLPNKACANNRRISEKRIFCTQSLLLWQGMWAKLQLSLFFKLLSLLICLDSFCDRCWQGVYTQTNWPQSSLLLQNKQTCFFCFLKPVKQKIPKKELHIRHQCLTDTCGFPGYIVFTKKQIIETLIWQLAARCTELSTISC